MRIPQRKVPYIPVPITKTTDYRVYLLWDKVVGPLESVKTVYSAAIQHRENDPAPSKTDSIEFQPKETLGTSQPLGKGNERPKMWDPPVDLTHLTETQPEATQKVLQEECQAFALNGDNVGCTPFLKMHISLYDTSPVQKTYMSVPKPLHNKWRNTCRICWTRAG